LKLETERERGRERGEKQKKRNMLKGGHEIIFFCRFSISTNAVQHTEIGVHLLPWIIPKFEVELRHSDVEFFNFLPCITSFFAVRLIISLF